MTTKLGIDIEFTEQYLRKIFEIKLVVYGGNPIEKQIFYDKDCPSFEVYPYSILPPEKRGYRCSKCQLEILGSNTLNCLRCSGENTMQDLHVWTVLFWQTDYGDRDTPPDVSESEVGHFPDFHKAIEAIWMDMARQELEVIRENLGWEEYVVEEAELYGLENESKS